MSYISGIQISLITIQGLIIVMQLALGLSGAASRNPKLNTLVMLGGPVSVILMCIVLGLGFCK